MIAELMQLEDLDGPRAHELNDTLHELARVRELERRASSEEGSADAPHEVVSFLTTAGTETAMPDLEYLMLPEGTEAAMREAAEKQRKERKALAEKRRAQEAPALSVRYEPRGALGGAYVSRSSLQSKTENPESSPVCSRTRDAMSLAMPVWNCTPHPVTVYDPTKTHVLRVIPKHCEVRLKQSAPDTVGYLRLENSYDMKYVRVLERPRYYDVEGLPPVPLEGECPALIVSMLTAEWLEAHPGRWPGPVLCVASGPEHVVRNDGPVNKGAILGTTALVNYT